MAQGNRIFDFPAKLETAYLPSFHANGENSYSFMRMGDSAAEKLASINGLNAPGRFLC